MEMKLVDTVKSFERRHNVVLVATVHETLIFQDNETKELMEIDESNIGINGEEYYMFDTDYKIGG